jgi:ABC-type polysaccharide/polyol phosphate transport system ATPase subunit
MFDMSISDIAIDVRDLSLRLTARGLGPEVRPADTIATVGGYVSERNRRSSIVQALDTVTFFLPRGESLAIIGRNGSGKSSLMRVLAGIYPATSGIVRIDGRITTLFSNQIGVNHNATGIENIRLVGMVMGFPLQRIDALIEDVAAFSELGEYLDMPMRIYSAGMRARLGFGIATGVDPDILLIDEVFGTGDQDFKAKARARMQRFLARAGTTLMASHSIELLREFCSVALWLDRGRMKMLGPLEEVRKAYIQSGKADTDHKVDQTRVR